MLFPKSSCIFAPPKSVIHRCAYIISHFAQETIINWLFRFQPAFEFANNGGTAVRGHSQSESRIVPNAPWRCIARRSMRVDSILNKKLEALVQDKFRQKRPRWPARALRGNSGSEEECGQQPESSHNITDLLQGWTQIVTME